MTEVQCGFLTYHRPMDGFPYIVRYKGQWMPEALITGGRDKRFSDAELAAEVWMAWGDVSEYQLSSDVRKAEVFERFATHDHDTPSEL